MMTNVSKVFKNFSKLRYLKRSSLFILSVRHNHLSNKAISDGENIVGCSLPVFDLKWLPEVDLESHFRKLTGSQHPITNTIRDLTLNESLSWSLIVLLVSKAAGLSENCSKLGNDLTAGIFQKQMVLARITEMIRSSHIFHKNIVNIRKEDDRQNNVLLGNKLSLLIGDYLQSESRMQLAGLKCNKLIEIVTSTFRDLAEAEFIEPQDGQNRPLPALPLPTKETNAMPNHLDQDIFVIEEILGNAKSEWTLRHLLGGASLLAKSCQAAMVLADHSEDLEQSAYTIGRSIALSQQIQTDISNFKSTEFGLFSLISAPMMFYIQDNIDFYQILMKQAEIDDINYAEIRNLVITGNAIEKSLELKDEFVFNGLEALTHFPENEAKNALINILKSI